VSAGNLADDGINAEVDVCFRHLAIIIRVLI
jgi:hypothetical protein